MESGSLTLTTLLLLLCPLLLFAHDSFAPSPSPSPSPSPRTTPPKQVASTNFQLVVPPPPPPPRLSHHRAHNGHRDHPPGVVKSRSGNPRQLNLGEKVGLAFLVVAVVLQVVLGGFLVFKRLQLRKMARSGQRMEAPSPAHSS
ncbi:hypothetical protein Cni_G02973 [Canna indica]|uniref:Uncharacterized protein n=1 Tax=Canna indica TaxID=4628 RepID=A0AAQ3JT07_9LILI|nr:hypothetical protein Cni_G02973 [Canna indica]